MVEVDLNHIYKKYEGNDKYSVNDFDLHIKDKEFIVFVGPSGCGKSTTLRMVAGLEDISKGTLEIDHKVMNDVAPKDRHIAMVFQNYALYPHMTIYDNIAFSLKLRHVDKAEIDKNDLVKYEAAIFVRWLEHTKTEELPKNLSFENLKKKIDETITTEDLAKLVENAFSDWFEVSAERAASEVPHFQ